MKATTIFAIALGLGSLAACNKSPQQQAADNYEANADNAADQMEANVDNAAENMTATSDNAADAMKAAADNKSDAMKNAADQKADAMKTASNPVPTRPHAGGMAGGASGQLRSALFCSRA